MVLPIAEFLNQRHLPVIDVRSPIEFERGHIPGAHNMPLFTNEERSIIGTLYHNQGSKEATKRGLEMFRPRLKAMVGMAEQAASGGELLIYCWRGGMRSSSMAWLFNVHGLKTHTLEGGYKAYRHFVLNHFSHPLPLIIIGGMTGAGKTEVLECIEKLGKQVIHLERLACHKGSVFGAIDMPPQPTTEQFENDLFEQLYACKDNENIYLEDESIAIGRVYVPRAFFQQMLGSPLIHLDVSIERRVNHLVSQYGYAPAEILADGVKRLAKRLGPQLMNKILNCIEWGDVEQAIQQILLYYDKTYRRTLRLHPRKTLSELCITDETLEIIARNVITLAAK
jgi:tRNA 2-selenouridine synthase